MAACRLSALLTGGLCSFSRSLSGKSRINGAVCKFSHSANDSGYGHNPAEVFFKPQVQQLLQDLTGIDHEKVFKKQMLGATLEPPKYELLTQEELDHLMEDATQRAKQKLKMPPLLGERQPIDNVLSTDPEIQGFDKAKYVFADISFGVSDWERKIVVRDPSGVLRDASWEERSKVNQIYFPFPGKRLVMPKMFEDTHLKGCLERGEYEFILERACVQFEPDDPEYIRVTRKTYNYVDDNRHYEQLRSTRHFGPFVLHLVLSSRLDDLLLHLITSKNISNVVMLVKLFHLVKGTSVDGQDLDIVEGYIEEFCLKKAPVQLAWQTYMEIRKQELELTSVNQLSS